MRLFSITTLKGLEELVLTFLVLTTSMEKIMTVKIVNVETNRSSVKLSTPRWKKRSRRLPWRKHKTSK